MRKTRWKDDLPSHHKIWYNFLSEAKAMDIEIPWLERLDEKREKPDEIEEIDYVTMLEELEFR